MHVILLIKHSEYEFQRFIVRNWRRGGNRKRERKRQKSAIHRPSSLKI